LDNFEKNLGRLHKKDKGKGIKAENGKDVLVARDRATQLQFHRYRTVDECSLLASR
jgi:hypothetical protein